MLLPEGVECVHLSNSGVLSAEAGDGLVLGPSSVLLEHRAKGGIETVPGGSTHQWDGIIKGAVHTVEGTPLLRVT